MRDLSPRQREILALVAAGRTSKEIAGELGISESTVNWHIANVFERLGASSRAEAVATALREDAQLSEDPTTAPKRRARPPLPLTSVALAVAVTLVLGLLGGAFMAGWNVAPPTAPSASAAPSNRAPQSPEPTARPTGVLAPTPEATNAPEIAPTSLPVASPLPDDPALMLPRLPSVPSALPIPVRLPLR